MTFLQKSLKPGFSIVELAVALLIMGLLMSLVGPRVVGLLTSGRKTSTQNTLKVVKQAVKQYKMTVGTYPAKLQDLIDKPEGASGWDGPYVGDEDSANPEIPKDAWGQDLMYELKPRGSKPPFDLYSQGDPDKEEDRIDAK